MSPVRRWTLTALVALLAGVAPLSAAPSPEQVKDVARDLVCLCGTCNRESLATCLCGFATAERDSIAALLHAGQTRSQIVDQYVDRFGPMVLANPPAGYDVVWVIPFVMLAVGVVGVRQVLVYWRRDRPVAAAPATPAGDDVRPPADGYGDRLRRDLDTFES